MLYLHESITNKGKTNAKECENEEMLWDEQYLYVGFNVEDPNVWAVVGKDAGEPREIWTVSPRAGNKFIMLRDTFLKVFLDPDGDGKNYFCKEVFT